MISVMNSLFQFASNNSAVRCCFDTATYDKPEYYVECNRGKAEIFFANTNDLISQYHILEKYIDNNDKIEAGKFKFDKDRYTYLFCHTLLRLILSKRLNMSPEDLLITYDSNKKPYLQGNPLYFNISHTRDSFAIILSEQFRVGIDLEKVDMNIDFNSLLRKSFSYQEREFILELPVESCNRFFLLWTRKEALLKAIGSGITSDLSNIEVLMKDNILNRLSFWNITDDSVFCDHYIYSKKIFDNWISVAAPEKSELIFHYTDMEKSIDLNYFLSI